MNTRQKKIKSPKPEMQAQHKTQNSGEHKKLNVKGSVQQDDLDPYDQNGSYRRRPLDRMSESSEVQDRVPPPDYNSFETMIVRKQESSSRIRTKTKPVSELSQPSSHIYPIDSLHNFEEGSRRQGRVEPNENGHAQEDSSHEEEEDVADNSVVPPLQKSPLVRERRQHIGKAEIYAHISYNTTPKKSSPLKKTTPKKSTSGYTLLYISIGCLVAVIVSILLLVLYYNNAFDSLPIPNFQTSNFLPKTNPSPPQIDIAAIMDDLKRDFNEQPPMTFKIVKSAINQLNKPNPKEPAIIALLAEPAAADICRRFARRLTESVSSYSNVVAISGHAYSEQDPDVAKKAIDDLLIGGLKENMLGAVFVDRLDYIPGDAALIFHTYCDHENAPFKRVIYVMTVVSDQTQLGLVEPKEWDTKFQEHLYKSWSVLGIDQISALMSRLTVRVAAIVPKDKS